MIIRPEAPGDEAAIGAITATAFTGHPHSEGSEPRIIERLRKAGALTLSLVAEDDGRIVGHVAFSPVTLSGGETGWYGVGPISVEPGRQRQGIGSALMRKGLEWLKAHGANGCALVGDPGYYQRFGFRAMPELRTADVPPEFFLVLPLRSEVPLGIVAFHPVFFGDAA
ncbi:MULTISPECIES: GNAT family N-acetyltransferase [Alphaproteobacteria]|uniref:GCN5 family N-acetyltransferase n=2 Tax=Alphaproteobacteria TaxID=28211 RepID=A0A512HD01_9HYPH|nr:MULTISPECIES: N-acetyltransferase [Alphaproteobacteria]GEO83315.1 GCN5 family N-acetyltransferase [Ciceribacter naphthalenivorans]GLR20291.1 GCN5 family N-acetyltransferase [Ciceribacter naphthalenivorans]GLT03147.1 GCN5 family N-acetyltransferase [Sphingomonas psychrolutea]